MHLLPLIRPKPFQLGPLFNGNTVYQHERGTADFALKGHQMGGTPHFWMARLDIGRADLDIPKSWNAFIDYKHFEHGSFLGGMVLARYRIVILTVFAALHFGAGYVPRKDLLLEAFLHIRCEGH